MIKNIKIHNFKCFSDIEINFNKLTVLTGVNGSGKSSVIQSLLLYKIGLKNSLEKKEIIKLNDPNLINLGTYQNIINEENKDISFTITDQNNISDFVSYSKNPDNIRTLKIEKIEQNTKLNEKYFSYLNAERIGPRITSEISDNKLNSGSKGQFVNSVIDQATVSGLGSDIHEKVFIEEFGENFQSQVQAWLQSIIPNSEFQITLNNELNYAVIKYKKRDSGFNIFSTGTGFGITYCLPIIVNGLISSCSDDSIMVVENPEAHLHPSAQTKIGEFIALIASCGVQVVIETHSDHVVDGIRLSLKDKIIKPEELKTIFFSNSETDSKSIINEVAINEKGKISKNSPKGFFDEFDRNISRLLR